jgi:hypothetical protein
LADARCIAIGKQEPHMTEAPDPRAAAALTAMSLDLAELLATIDEVRTQLQRFQAHVICAQLDAAEHAMPIELR